MSHAALEAATLADEERFAAERAAVEASAQEEAEVESCTTSLSRRSGAGGEGQVDRGRWTEVGGQGQVDRGRWTGTGGEVDDGHDSVGTSSQ